MRCLAMPLTRGLPNSETWKNDTLRCWPGIGRGIGLGAREALDQCRRRDARLEALYNLYEKRLGHLAADAPAADWNGIFIAATE